MSTTHFPSRLFHPADNYLALKAIAKNYLIYVARKRTVVTYQELITDNRLAFNLDFAQDRGAIGQLLGDISRDEVQEGRPPISVVVITAHNLIPSSGFYG